MPPKDNDWKKQCQKILDVFSADKNAQPFLAPVPWKEYGLYDYPQIVKHPMDFGTIQKKINGKNYSGPSDFAADMRQVFANCMLYNQEGSDYYVIADKFTKQFEKRLLKVKMDSGGGGASNASNGADPIKPPTFPEKAKFSEALYDVAPDILGRVVQMLDEKCEASLDKSTPEEVEISIDLIDPKTFREIDMFLKSSIALAKNGGKRKVASVPSEPVSKKSKTS
jgi:hypothetical protein